MNLLEATSKRIDRWINWKFRETSPGVADFLINHERKPRFINNLMSQLIVIERRKKTRSNAETMRDLIDSYTHVFCKAAIELKTKSMLSEARKTQIINEGKMMAGVDEFEKEQKELRKEFKVDEN